LKKDKINKDRLPPVPLDLCVLTLKDELGFGAAVMG